MSEKLISIPPRNIQMIKVKVKGDTPVIFHKWSEKAIKMIEDKQAKKAQKAKEKRDPQKEYKESYYYDKDGNIAMPANWIKSAMLNAVRGLDGITMAECKQLFFVVGDEQGLIPLKYESEEMRTDMVRIGQGTADVRYRGQVNGWSAEVMIKFNANAVSEEQIINLLQESGFASGIGEWRPSSPKKSGEFGMYSIVTD